MTAILLGWVIYRLASGLVDVAIALDAWAYRRQRRAIRVYDAPSGWELETQPLATLSGRGVAAGSPTAPAAVHSPPPPPDTQPLRAVAAGSSGAGPVEGPARSRHTPRHASGRIRWPFMPPIGATP